MSLDQSDIGNDILVEPQQGLPQVADCITNEQKLARIFQEIGDKTLQGYSVVREMLLLSGFGEEKINGSVVQGYNIFEKLHRTNLMQVCLKKSGDDTIVNGRLRQKMQELEDLVLAITELKKSAPAILRGAFLDKYVFSNKLRTCLILLGIAVSIYYLIQRGDDSNDSGKEDKQDVPSQTINHLETA